MEANVTSSEKSPIKKLKHTGVDFHTLLVISIILNKQFKDKIFKKTSALGSQTNPLERVPPFRLKPFQELYSSANSTTDRADPCRYLKRKLLITLVILD